VYLFVISSYTVQCKRATQVFVWPGGTKGRTCHFINKRVQQYTSPARPEICMFLQFSLSAKNLYMLSTFVYKSIFGLFL